MLAALLFLAERIVGDPAARSEVETGREGREEGRDERRAPAALLSRGRTAAPRDLIATRSSA